MKTKTSIKSNGFFHPIHKRFSRKNGSIKEIVSRIRKIVYSRPIKNQHEEKHTNDCTPVEPAPRHPKNQQKITKLKTSITCGFGSILNKYHHFFRTGQKTQQDKAHYYLQGLFCAERGKRNIERMVEEVSGSEYEALQHFISNSPWGSEGLMLELARNVSTKLQPYGKIGCTVDEKAHLKKGTKSVGVARQYAGTSGKVDNCQVGVYLSLTADKYSSLTNCRLFLPQK